MSRARSHWMCGGQGAPIRGRDLSHASIPRLDRENIPQRAFTWDNFPRMLSSREGAYLRIGGSSLQRRPNKVVPLHLAEIRGEMRRDIELAFADRSGRCVLSGTAACHLCKRLRQAYHAFAGRDLSRYKVRYMFVEDLAERLRREGQQCEATLAAWGVTETGSRVLLGLAPPTKNFRRFLRDLRARGLRDAVQFIPPF